MQQNEILSAMWNFYNKLDALNRPQMEAALPQLTHSEVALLDLIATLTQPNVTKLAEKMYMTRGAISKLSKKLITKGYVEAYQLPSNKKERYFQLTLAGQKVVTIHEQMNQQFQMRDAKIFEALSETEEKAVLAFFERYIKHLDQHLKINS